MKYLTTEHVYKGDILRINREYDNSWESYDITFYLNKCILFKVLRVSHIFGRVDVLLMDGMFSGIEVEGVGIKNFITYEPKQKKIIKIGELL